MRLAVTGMIQPAAALESYELVWDFSALAELEVQTKGACGLASGLSGAFLESMAAWQFRGLLYAALRARQPEITLAEAGAIGGRNMPAAVRAITEAWMLSMPEKKATKGRRAAGKKLTSRELWESCWSAARFSLYLTDQQFGELTPRQFHLLLDRHREEKELQKTLFGIVAAAVGNFSQRAPERHLQPSDFVGGEHHEPKQSRSERKAAMQRTIRLFDSMSKTEAA